MNVNLGGIGLQGFINVDISWRADKRVNLEKRKLPFKNNTVDFVLSMSFINYLPKDRAQIIIKDIHRALKPGGVCRMGVQDLRTICLGYLSGEFSCERVNRWFNSPSTDGYKANGKRNQYVYDYDELALMFVNAGFNKLGNFKFGQSPSGLGKWDNRPEQMFYLETIKD